MQNLGTINNDKDVATKEYVDNGLSAKAAGTSVPASASVNSSGVVTFANSGGTSLFTVQLPMYTGSVS